METQTKPTSQETRGVIYERPRDVIARTHLSKTTVYNLLASGRVPVRRLGRSVLVEAGAIDRLLADEGERLQRA